MRILALNVPLPNHKIDREALSGVALIGSVSEGKPKNEDVTDATQQKMEIVYYQSETSIEGSSLKGMPLSDLSHLKSYHSSAFKKHPSNYMTRGLRKLDAENWLRIDSEYDQYCRARRQLLSEPKEEVLQCLPGGGSSL